MKKKLVVLSSFVLGFAPFMALAQASGGCTVLNSSGQTVNAFAPGTIQNILCNIGNVLDTLIPILIILGVVYFIWGVVSYVISDDEEAKKKGRDRMIYGIIGLVVIVAMWGLVSIVNKTLGLGVGTGAPTVLPTVPF
jgi:hypothetical protein